MNAKRVSAMTPEAMRKEEGSQASARAARSPPFCPQSLFPIQNTRATVRVERMTWNRVAAVVEHPVGQ